VSGAHWSSLPFSDKIDFLLGVGRRENFKKKILYTRRIALLFLDVVSGIKKPGEVLCILRNVRPCCTQLGDIQDITQQVESKFYQFQIFGCPWFN
jgi:hypothetical protein